jgi:signal transduction histidine kinase
MSFGDKAILWLHIAAVVFTIGPGTAAIMSTPRYIRNRNSVIVGYLFRTTRIYALGSLLVLVFGLILTGMTHKFSAWWISVSLTLFVVAFILLLLILRDQRRAITALDAAAGTPVGGMAVADNVEEDIRADAAQAAAAATEAGPVTSAEPAASASPTGTHTGRHAAIAAPPAAARTGDLRVAAVERGRIASIGGVTALIWLVILVLMVWH